MNTQNANPSLPLVGKIQQEHVIHPDCRCQKCGSIFFDHYDIYPGPALCPSCLEDDTKAARRAARNNKRRH